MMFLTLEVTEWGTKNYSDTIRNQWMRDLGQALIPYEKRKRRNIQKERHPTTQRIYRIKQKQNPKST
jgi:hypothetical protein